MIVNLLLELYYGSIFSVPIRAHIPIQYSRAWGGNITSTCILKIIIITVIMNKRITKNEWCTADVSLIIISPAPRL